MKDYSYAWEKLMSAVYSLVEGQPQAFRMISALENMYAIKTGPDKKPFPPNLQKKFDELWSQIPWKEPEGHYGRIEVTTRSLSEEQLNDIARKIVYLYDAICRYQEPWSD